MSDEFMEARIKEAVQIENEEMPNAVGLKRAMAMQLAMRRSKIRKLKAAGFTKDLDGWNFTPEELHLLIEIEKTDALQRIASQLEALGAVASRRDDERR